jgi:hypothetical protein
LRRIVIALIFAHAISACSSPASPSVPNVQGLWHGGWVAHTDSCTGIAAYCDQVRSGFVTGGFNLRLTQSGRTLRAFIYVCGNEIDVVTGVLAADGTITLSGQGAVPFYEPMTLSRFHATISGTSMTGTFACTVSPGGFTPNTFSMTGWLQSVSRVSADSNVLF